MKKIFLLIIILYYSFIIFSFSAQPAKNSSAQSGKIVDIIYNAVAKIDVSKAITKNDFTKVFEPFVRKLAHFGNFLILAVFISIYVHCFDKTITFSALIVIILCLMVASFDECHQLFVKGRSGKLFDVIIDTLGASVGILCFNLIEFMKNNCGRFLYEKY